MKIELTYSTLFRFSILLFFLTSATPDFVLVANDLHFFIYSQWLFACSSSPIGTLQQVVKHVQTQRQINQTMSMIFNFGKPNSRQDQFFNYTRLFLQRILIYNKSFFYNRFTLQQNSNRSIHLFIFTGVAFGVFDIIYFLSCLKDTKYKPVFVANVQKK